MRHRFFRHLSVTLTLLLFLGLTAVPALFPGSQSSIYANAEEFFNGFYIYDTEKYQTFAATTMKDRDDFVTVEMLENIGTFEYLFFNDKDDLYSYSYRLLLNNGHAISFKIAPPSLDDTYRIPDSSLGTNMVQLNTNETGAYIRNGIWYWYGGGGLFCIEWRSHGTLYRISPSGSYFADYSLVTADNFVELLMTGSFEDQETALSMLPDLIGNIDPVKEEANKNVWKHITAWGVPIVLIAAFIFIRHRRR